MPRTIGKLSSTKSPSVKRSAGKARQGKERQSGLRRLGDLETARRMKEMLDGHRDIRQRKVRRIGAAIRAQKYENNLKLQIAIDRLLGELE